MNKNASHAPTCGPQSPGELDAASYLTQRGLRFRYEPFLTGAKPDFVVEHPKTGSIVIEVYEPEYRLPRNPDGSFRSGPIASQDHLVRRGLNSGRKSRQAAAAHERGIPFVLAVANSNTELHIDEHVIPSALFGSLQFTWAVGGTAAHPGGHLVFGPGGRLQEDLNTRFSAVALLSSFVPGLARLERMTEGRVDPEGPLQELIDTFLAARAEEIEAGRFDESKKTHRLQIFHNPFAGIPLPMEFAGPHDDQWAEFEENRSYAEVSNGVLGSEVPGRWPLGHSPSGRTGST